MRFFYRVTPAGHGWTAECDDLDTCGRGVTPEAALEQLRELLFERFDRPNAVAPPDDAPPTLIDLVPIDEAYRVHSRHRRLRAG